MNRWLPRAAVLLAVTALGACATLQQITALRHVDFSLGGVENVRLAGIALDRVASYEDLSTLDVGRLALALARKDLPLDLQVGVRAENPMGNAASATLAQLSWTLILDDRETISGTLDRTYALPPGEPVEIPLQVSLNLIDFFEGSAESLLNLAATLAGLDADPTRIALRAVPTIETPFGPMSYPSPITVVNRTVGGRASR